MKKITLEHITKIEGHAKLHLKISGGKVEKADLDIVEGARYFEGILNGKKYNDVSHIASRICGVCSVVHTLAAVSAVEKSIGCKVSEQTRQLREVLNIGGIIQSHVLHLYFLTLPDYAGAGSAISMAKKNPGIIERALRLKRMGNSIVQTIAGRDIHPLACVIGGFSRTPEQSKVDILVENLKQAKQDAIETVNLFMNIKYPELSMPIRHFALGGKDYFYSHKLIECEGNACFESKDFRSHFQEYLKPESTAEFVTQEGKSYFVGALSRLVCNSEYLTDESKRYANKILERKDNPFLNIPAQAVEILEGINRAIIILSNMKLVDEPSTETALSPCECEGISAIEAPRGILFHNYKFDKEGYCMFADIMTPTSQNLKYAEECIRAYAQNLLEKDAETIKLEIEKLIRAFDPCISCSTHFLELNIERDGGNFDAKEN